MSSQLQVTLTEHLNSGWGSNPALRTLIDDYAKYHMVLVVLGGLTLLLSLILAVVFWVRFRKVSKISKFRWPFEKKIYFSFGLILSLFSLFFALLFVANLSTSLKPLPGFRALAESTTVPIDSEVGNALNDWVQSGENTFPPILKQKVQDRIDWQRPKAITCGVLLVIIVAISIRLWSYLINKSKSSELQWSIADRLLMIVGAVTFISCLVLAVMVVANAQGAIGPITISLLGVGG